MTSCKQDTKGAGRKQALSLARPGQAAAGREGWAHRPASASWGTQQVTSHLPSVPRLHVSSGLWVTGRPVTCALVGPVSRPEENRSSRGCSQRHLHKPGQLTRWGLRPGSPAGGSWLRPVHAHRSPSAMPSWLLESVHPALWAGSWAPAVPAGGEHPPHSVPLHPPSPTQPKLQGATGPPHKAPEEFPRRLRWDALSQGQPHPYLPLSPPSVGKLRGGTGPAPAVPGSRKTRGPEGWVVGGLGMEAQALWASCWAGWVMDR